MKKLILSVFAVAFLTTLIGCETIKGLGRDLENTGEAIEDAVR